MRRKERQTTTDMYSFEYLVRFEDEGGAIRYGEASVEDASSGLVGSEVNVYDGDLPWDKDFHASGTKATVSKVIRELNCCVTVGQSNVRTQILCPLPATPIIHGVGLNYKAHAEEGDVRMYAESAKCLSNRMQIAKVAPVSNCVC